MNSVKPLAARFYRLKSRQAPVGMYLQQLDTVKTTNADGAVADAAR